MGKSADELRCLTSHLAAVQKPSAHGIVVCEHARRSVPGAAILLVQANGERRNASAERRRSGASRENTQHALELNPAARTRPKVFATGVRHPSGGSQRNDISEQRVQQRNRIG